MQIIERDYGDPTLSLVGVSNNIHVSPNYLSTLIKKETGASFVDLLTKKRIETARELVLGSAMKMREIAERCGYSDQHYFSYCFKKYCGMSPNEKTESITFFYHYDIGGRTGYTFFTVVYLFLFITVCIQYETGSADQQ